MTFSLRIATLLLVAACGSGGDGGTSPVPPPAPPPAPPPPPPPGPQPNTTAAVSMGTADDGYGATVPSFIPATVTIVRAGTVTWTNGSGIEHGVTFNATPGAPANIPPPAAGATARTFPVAGEFLYVCPVHAGMTGRVVVQ